MNAENRCLRTAENRIVLGQSWLDGLGGRGWTERRDGSPGVSGCRPPPPATPELDCGEAFATQAQAMWGRIRQLVAAEQCLPLDIDAIELFVFSSRFVVRIGILV